MYGIIPSRSSIRHRRGIALLAVLFIIMAITILSLGFIAHSTTELSCGENMERRVAMDQLAASGLEQARGLILQPQEVTTDVWTGATGVQLAPGGDSSYDVTVVPSSTDHVTYTITSDAYRSQGAAKLDRSVLSADLRLDPAVAFWTGVNSRLYSNITVGGDLYCGGNVLTQGTINGDVFASGTISGNAAGRKSESATSRPVEWPFGTDTAAQIISALTSHYTWQPLASATLSTNLGTAGTPCVFYRSGDLAITSGVTINGMLLVDGRLTVSSNSVTVTASKNLPALYVTGDLTVGAVNSLHVTGLAVVDGAVYISGAATGARVSGACFTKSTLTETTPDSMGAYDGVLNGLPTRCSGRMGAGALQFDGIDDYVRTAATLTVPGDYTLTFWINADSVQNSSGTILSTHTGALARLAVYFSSGQLKAQTSLSNKLTNIALSSLTGGWHQVSISVDSVYSMKPYLDGVLTVDPNSLPKLMMGAGAGYVYIGSAGTAAAASMFKGSLDDVRIYGRILSDADVQTLAAGGSISTGAPLAWWKFDESGAQVTMEADPVRSSIVTWPGGVRTNWSPAGGAFFKQITRPAL
jgi:hypothetical protein